MGRRMGINNLAPQYGLPPIRMVAILPKDERADIYSVRGLGDRLYSSEDEVNSIWGEYLVCGR
jgi:hypothetical protein